MKTDRALEEVWKWKDELYEERKNLSMEEIVKIIEKNGESIERKYNLNLRTINNSEEIILTGL